MSKDFKDSYEQRKWEIVVSAHSRLVTLLSTLKTQKVIDMTKRNIEEYEHRSPQLKKAFKCPKKNGLSALT